jgi:hypothetical protein
VSPYSLSLLLLGGVTFLIGCSDGGTGPIPPPSTDCADVAPTNLSVGADTVIDASQTPCIRLPAAGSDGAEYIYAALATDATETASGVTADYKLQGDGSGTAVVASAARVRSGPQKPNVPAAFHAMLRARERALSERTGAASFARGAAAAVVAPTPPTVGDKRNFEVCSTTDCNAFITRPATAKVVGQRVAIYLDDTVPSGGYAQADLDKVGELFDSHLYPIDTTAFGRESDLDNNGVVVVLLTPSVNALTPDCNTSGTVILGYFFGLDLLPSEDHSNDGEVFYGLVPDPGNSACDISKEFATAFLPPTFIHEFQHMISFNQHVLVGQGAAEDTWLNEGLSHFAEELGGRLIPDTECQPAFDSCNSQFEQGDVINSYAFLDSLELKFLIEPGNSNGTLAERGGNWLFVRWLADHFASTQPTGTELTRALVQTSRHGSANVEAVTGENFSTLVGQWQLANYLDDLPNFTPVSDRLQYSSINFRALYQSLFDSGAVDKPYPLTPDVAGAGTYTSTGTLHAGSGHHVSVVQQPLDGEVTFLLTGPGGTSALPTAVKPRVAIARIR